MCIELMLLAVNFNFVAFARQLGDLHGQVFVFFIMTVAAAESAIGLAILVVLFRERRTHRRRRTGHDERLSMIQESILLDHRAGAAARGDRRRPRPAASIGRVGAHSVTIAGRRAVVRAFRLRAQAAAGRRADLRRQRLHLAGQRRHPHGSRLPGRPPDRADDGGGDVRVAVRARLHHRLHARRSRATSASSRTSRCSRSRC